MRSTLQLISEPELEGVRERAFELMRRFASRPDWTSWEGIPLGEFILHAYRFFIEPVWQVELLERVLCAGALGGPLSSLLWDVGDPAFTRVMRDFVRARRPDLRVRYARSRLAGRLAGGRAAELFGDMARRGPAAVAQRVGERLFPGWGVRGRGGEPAAVGPAATRKPSPAGTGRAEGRQSGEPRGGSLAPTSCIGGEPAVERRIPEGTAPAVAAASGVGADRPAASGPAGGPAAPVLFVLEYQNHYKSFVPLAEELDRRGVPWQVLGYRPALLALLLRRGVPFVNGLQEGGEGDSTIPATGMTEGRAGHPGRPLQQASRAAGKGDQPNGRVSRAAGLAGEELGGEEERTTAARAAEPVAGLRPDATQAGAIPMGRSDGAAGEQAPAARARAARRDLTRRWRRLRRDPEFGRAFTYRGVPLLPALRRPLRAFYEYQFVLGVRGLETSRQAIARLRPALLVVLDDMSFYGRIAVEAARGLGILSLGIQHGAIGDVNHYRVVAADRMAVWGTVSARLLAAAGADERKLVVTGQPRFDRLAALPGDQEAARRELGLPLEGRVVLYTPDPFTAHSRYRPLAGPLLRAVVQAVAAVDALPGTGSELAAAGEAAVSGEAATAPGRSPAAPAEACRGGAPPAGGRPGPGRTILAVKLHPVDEPGFYRRAAAEAGGGGDAWAASAGETRDAARRPDGAAPQAGSLESAGGGRGSGIPLGGGVVDLRLFQDCDIVRLLQAADVLVARATTVMVEAVLCGLPLVTLELFGYRDPIPCAELGAAVAVREERELAPALAGLLGGDEELRERLRQGREAFLREFLAGADGSASSRTADLILSLARPASHPVPAAGGLRRPSSGSPSGSCGGVDA